jgi:hypothetical protein
MWTSTLPAGTRAGADIRVSSTRTVIDGRGVEASSRAAPHPVSDTANAVAAVVKVRSFTIRLGSRSLQ